MEAPHFELDGLKPNLNLRQLDVDDLYLLFLLGSGLRLVDASSKLGLTQPAITQRIRKIETAIGCSIIDRSVRGTKLTERGFDICKVAGEVLHSLEALFEKHLF